MVVIVAVLATVKSVISPAVVRDVNLGASTKQKVYLVHHLQ